MSREVLSPCSLKSDRRTSPFAFSPLIRIQVMFPDLFIIRLVLRIGIFVLNSVAPFSILWTCKHLLSSRSPSLPLLFVQTLIQPPSHAGVSYLTYPAPPPVIFTPASHLDTLYAYDRPLRYLTYWFLIETIWRFLHAIGRRLVASGVWDLKSPKEVVGTEERWRLWVKMLESSEDPWEWMGGMFLGIGYRSAPMGMEDIAVKSVVMKDVGRTNIEDFIAHFLFGLSLKQLRKDSLARDELHSMVSLLELVLSKNLGTTFRFLPGRSPHKGFLIYNEPIVTTHHPFIFYTVIWITSELGNLALWLAGFRYYGSKATWPFPLFFMRGSRKALDALQGDRKISRDGIEPLLADKVGYWFHPGSKAAQLRGDTPILFFHGISGTYGPSPFLILLEYFTGRPIFVPVMPYLHMRLHSPSTILTRKETAASVRQMIWRHGFSVEERDDDSDDEDWRKGRVVLVGHSLGGGFAGWILRDAPDVVAGAVLIDPMSALLWMADGPRSFFKTKCKTAGEIFFRYFALERGITHFLSRHLRWTDSVVFGPKPVTPLPPYALDLIPSIAREPLDVPYDLPNYAPSVSPCPEGPIPAIFFYSRDDCILNVKKISRYLRGTGFDDDTLRIMPKQHAGILMSPYWTKEVAKAIDVVAAAGEKIERDRLEEDDEDEKEILIKM